MRYRWALPDLLKMQNMLDMFMPGAVIYVDTYDLERNGGGDGQLQSPHVRLPAPKGDEQQVSHYRFGLALGFAAGIMVVPAALHAALRETHMQTTAGVTTVKFTAVDVTVFEARCYGRELEAMGHGQR